MFSAIWCCTFCWSSILDRKVGSDWQPLNRGAPSENPGPCWCWPDWSSGEHEGGPGLHFHWNSWLSCASRHKITIHIDNDDNDLFAEMSPKIKGFYGLFMGENQIELKNDIEAEHGFVWSSFPFLHCNNSFSHLQLMEVSALSWSLLTMSISVITMGQLRCWKRC